MSMVKKTGVPFFIEMNSHQRHFGATGFDTKIIDLTSGVITPLGSDAEEVIETVTTPATATAGAAAGAGDKVITLEAGSTLSDGNVIKDTANNMYYVESIAGNQLRLKFPLEAPIAFGDTLTQVGNTGLYKLTITINTAGNYGVYISNPSIDMRSKGAQFTVKDIILEDVDAKVDTKSAEIIAKLDALQATIEAAEQTDFTVYSG